MDAMMTMRASQKRRAALERAHRAERYRDWHLPIPRGLWSRLAHVRVLDGRSMAEWARAVLSDAVDRLLLDRPGWAWARPGAPFWSRRSQSIGEVTAAPIGALAGCERVLVLARIPGAFGLDLDPQGDGSAFLADVVPDAKNSGPTLRGVILRATDVLPWRNGVPRGRAPAETSAAVV